MYIYLSLGGVILCSYIYQHLSATEDIVYTLLQRCQRLALKQCFCYLLQGSFGEQGLAGPAGEAGPQVRAVLSCHISSHT